MAPKRFGEYFVYLMAKEGYLYLRPPLTLPAKQVFVTKFQGNWKGAGDD